MAYQTVTNGRAVAAADPKSQSGVIGGVSSYGSDLATLGTLQLKLVACDLKECTKTAAPAIAGLIVLGTLAGASIVIALAGFSLWLADRLQTQPGVVMMIVALAGLILAGAISYFLVRTLSTSLGSFRRSQEEFERNLAWIKTTLVHSGR